MEEREEEGAREMIYLWTGERDKAVCFARFS